MYNLLNGIKVIDLTSVVLGPYATQLLGDFGADVIKIETPSGDLFRMADAGRSPKMGAGFLNCNRNKRSISLDLKTPSGMQILQRLAATADVFVHNMRSKSAEKLGLSYEQVKQMNGRIIYCNACGFGQGGHYQDQPAYDDTVQAVSGLAAINADAMGTPRYLPTILCDKVAGLHLAIAILAAVAGRFSQGQSAAIEVPMFETMAAFLLVEHLAGETFCPAIGDMGYSRLTSQARKPFATKDGYISILPYNGTHWKNFLTLIGEQQLAEDPRVTDPFLRSKNLDMLYALIEQAAPAHTTAAWLDLLSELDIPCARIKQLNDLRNDPHLNAVGFFNQVVHPTEGELCNLRSSFRVKNMQHHGDRLAPELGGDGMEILKEIGLNVKEIEEARQSGGLFL